MSTPHSSAHPAAAAALEMAYAQDGAIRPLPPAITLPLIALTSAGLWVLIYKAVWGVISIFR